MTFFRSCSSLEDFCLRGRNGSRVHRRLSLGRSSLDEDPHGPNKGLINSQRQSGLPRDSAWDGSNEEPERVSPVPWLASLTHNELDKVLKRCHDLRALFDLGPSAVARILEAWTGPLEITRSRDIRRISFLQNQRPELVTDSLARISLILSLGPEELDLSEQLLSRAVSVRLSPSTAVVCSVAHTVRHLSQCDEISLSGAARLSAKQLGKLTFAPSLKSLDLRGCSSLTPDAMAAIGRMSKLDTLAIPAIMTFSQETMLPLTLLTGLTRLNAADIGLTNSHFHLK